MAEVLKTLFKGPLKYDFTDQLLYKVPENKSVIIKDVLTKRFNNLQEYEFQINGIKVDDLNNRILNSGDELTCSFHNRDFLYFKEKNDNKGFEKYKIQNNSIRFIEEYDISNLSFGSKSDYLNDTLFYFNSEILKKKEGSEYADRIVFQDLKNKYTFTFKFGPEDEITREIVNSSNYLNKSLKSLFRDNKGNIYAYYIYRHQSSSKYSHRFLKIDRIEKTNFSNEYNMFFSKDPDKVPPILVSDSQTPFFKVVANGVYLGTEFKSFHNFKESSVNISSANGLFFHNFKHDLNEKSLIFRSQHNNYMISEIYHLDPNKKESKQLGFLDDFIADKNAGIKSILGSNKKFTAFGVKNKEIDLNGNNINHIENFAGKFINNGSFLEDLAFFSKSANATTALKIYEYYMCLFDLDTTEINRLYIKDFRTLSRLSNRNIQTTGANNYFNPVFLGFNVENSLIEVKGVEFS